MHSEIPPPLMKVASYSIQNAKHFFAYNNKNVLMYFIIIFTALRIISMNVPVLRDLKEIHVRYLILVLNLSVKMVVSVITLQKRCTAANVLLVSQVSVTNKLLEHKTFFFLLHSHSLEIYLS